MQRPEHNRRSSVSDFFVFLLMMFANDLYSFLASDTMFATCLPFECAIQGYFLFILGRKINTCTCEGYKIRKYPKKYNLFSNLNEPINATIFVYILYRY